ncbi:MULTISPECIES: MerR family transcriptional regulator [Pseudoxanthomonas]|jgi:MerR family mercuric resistance operon transcriptional regulator|uniref:MerR family transcriptional regulator n=1 Tax=Pseudoxanthomonas winnipegensis TaxID=2480810 RepID=A0A4Q8LYR9_9GAMM|nr:MULTISPECIES: MerR family transcriptional regulator [Pseudoxanthomonas]MBW8851221.1 MerR family transcriptional regulator [Xanthomonadales bacterium]MCA0392963.1 MerR family DNA-binding protein [Pseudomonadota bacterium]KAF1709828.1 MerR family transcriptional regulator [Pseudoxanthomonas kalamensis DSM 18571]KAF1711634.1 MerR family transcriptional regulator [Pseudoxanthomonas sacheonensis]RZZ87169.1 MerR family transcriptional regulator [Pseudoxanthomonas winnipegensis]
MAESALTISKLAASAGVHVETVRYYQRRRLLPEPQRPLGGFRHYGPADVTRLQFIRRAQAMGFTLDEIAGLLELKGKRACEQTRRLTELKLVDVRERLDALHRLEVDLMNLIAECSQAPGGESCPTLDRLEHATEHSDKRGRCAAIAD